MMIKHGILGYGKAFSDEAILYMDSVAIMGDQKPETWYRHHSQRYHPEQYESHIFGHPCLAYFGCFNSL